jgi:hypothetical protein
MGTSGVISCAKPEKKELSAVVPKKGLSGAIFPEQEAKYFWDPASMGQRGVSWLPLLISKFFVSKEFRKQPHPRKQLRPLLDPEKREKMSSAQKVSSQISVNPNFS